MSAVYTDRPLIDRPPTLQERPVVKGVVMQSSDASCGAASAATLLQAHGISASEPEMAPLCRTRRDGTAMLGIYRGLRLKTRDTTFAVVALTYASADDLIRTARENGPVLIAVGLPRFALRPVDPRYESEWGWTPGLRHAVVFFGELPNGKIGIGDPSAGREAWDRKALGVLWDGAGLYLKSR